MLLYYYIHDTITTRNFAGISHNLRRRQRHSQKIITKNQEKKDSCKKTRQLYFFVTLKKDPRN